MMDSERFRLPVAVRVAGLGDEEQTAQADAMATVLSWMLRFQRAARA